MSGWKWKNEDSKKNSGLDAFVPDIVCGSFG